MIKIFRTIAKWQQFFQALPKKNKSIGFVPTLGNLHAGHTSLLERSRRENNYTILSIFVNPTQFDNQNDLKNYPTTLANDLKIAKKFGVNYILIPNYQELYPDDYNFKVYEKTLSKQLCGKYRPEHFPGVLTIVLKLLMLTQPDKIYLGEKDWQQLQLIKNMITAFFINTEVISCPTIRDQNGLALSSRNQRLTTMQYNTAINFPRLLQSKKTNKQIIFELEKLGFKVDYIKNYNGRRFGAATIGKTRLIDNCKI